MIETRNSSLLPTLLRKNNQFKTITHGSSIFLPVLGSDSIEVYTVQYNHKQISK